MTMIGPKDLPLAARLEEALITYHQNVRPLHGLNSESTRKVFVAQLIDSIRRIRIVNLMVQRSRDAALGDPHAEHFDPLKAAVQRARAGDYDDAFWFVFLATHFGKHYRKGWRLSRLVYAGKGPGREWNWARVSVDPRGFRTWLHGVQSVLKIDGKVHFSNHRKYVSLDARSARGTGAAIQSYVRWINPPRTHREFFDSVLCENGNDPRRSFHALYESMSAVTTFGRMGKFDFLTMVSKLGLTQIEPGSTYMDGATGPYTGAKLLFGGAKTARYSRRALDDMIRDLEAHLQVGALGMQVMEDAICNWQKSPSAYQLFKG